MTDKELIEFHGFNPTDKLMNPMTGSIDTAENWASELADTEFEEDFSTLEKVN